jgi:predicted DNA helicase
MHVEPECWIGLHKAKKAILAGDHRQLNPTIKSTHKSVLDITLFERLATKTESKILKMLTTQYRMNEKIMKFPSAHLYNNKLVAHPSVKFHILCELPGLEETPETSQVLVFYDTIGCNLYESLADSDNIALSESKQNEGEAELVRKHVNSLVLAGLKPSDIVVLTPYNGQVALLKGLLREKYPGLEIGSVDGMQGREKEAVVLSLVRSNDAKEIGFLRDERRLNVAITRARRHLCLICDSMSILYLYIFRYKLIRIILIDQAKLFHQADFAEIWWNILRKMVTYATRDTNCRTIPNGSVCD